MILLIKIKELSVVNLYLKIIELVNFVNVAYYVHKLNYMGSYTTVQLHVPQAKIKRF